MSFKFLHFLSLFLLLSSVQISAWAQSPDESDVQRLKLEQVVTEIPKTAKRTLKKAFSKESIVPWMWIGGSTAVLYYYDEEILKEGQRFGRDIGLGNRDKTETVIEIKGQDILRLPTDTGSALYFLGDGWTHMSIAAGFLVNGYTGNSTRAFNTGVQLVHGMGVSTIFNQTLKRSFGREMPNLSTQKRGAWRPFPSFKAYNDNVAKYDAMPSGHIMTSALVFTVIHENYPEYDAWTLPIAGVWLTVLAYQMVNNGVHWASDYPLGIAMGYVIGRLAVDMGRDDSNDKEKQSEKPEPTTVFYPVITPESSTLNMVYSF